MLKRLAAYALLLALASPAALAAGPTGDTYAPADTGVNAATLSASPVARLRVQNYNAVTLYIQHTYVAATALNVSCTAGLNPAVVAPVGVANVATTGAITMADGSWSYPSGGSSRWYRILVAPLNDRLLNCTFSGTGATTDTVSVYAYAGDN